MRGMNGYWVGCQHLHGSAEAGQRHSRAWALLHNFAPWGPVTAKANEHLDHLADLTIPEKQVERIAHRIGDERLGERDAAVAAWAELPLARKFEAPAGVQPPDLAVVMVDGGRMQFRDPPEGPPAD